MSIQSKSKQYSPNTRMKHKLDTISDYILAEQIRDIISDLNRSSTAKRNVDPLNEQVLEYIYHRLEASKHPGVQDRIKHLIIDMQKQNATTNKFKKEKHEQLNESSPTHFVEEEDELTPSDYKHKQLEQKLKQQKLTQTHEYQTIYSKYHTKIIQSLKNKNKTLLEEECCNEYCPGIASKDILSECPSVKRIETILSLYHELMQHTTLWKKVPMTPIITTDIYRHQQIYNDFVHIKMYHIDADEKIQRLKNINKPSKSKLPYQSIAKTLCEHFENNYACKDMKNCEAFQRHYRDRTDEKAEKELFYLIKTQEKSKTVEIINNKDQILQEECDKLHSFFLHSTIKFTTNDNGDIKQNEEEANKRVDSITSYADGRSFSEGKNNNDKTKNEKQPTTSKPTTSKPTTSKKIYVGKREDEQWLGRIQAAESDKKSDEHIYRLLVQHMGVFRWQSAHGFRTGQNRGLAHLQPIFKNVKQEAMENQYYKASKDNWNQTLRKSKIFFNSFARRKIKTLYDGEFSDAVTDMNRTWKRGQDIALNEVVMLKLYTDFDKLQHELKKCFRWETIDGVWQKNTNTKEKELIEEIKEETFKHDTTKKQELEQRLREFWHWRVGLLLILNKYGKKINEENMVLYHGVNAKMILNPVATMAFYGPLSTTSSYHVAKTFATAKGMILKITSQYPRLDHCRAFDASVISDYPEEQEFLIGFIYMRVLEIRTRPIINDITNKKMWANAPLASKIRVIFFAIHLFREQMFSMSKHLEYYLVQFLKCNRMDCCTRYNKQSATKDIKESFLSFLCCEVAHHPQAITQRNDWKNEDEIRTKIMKILWTKFNLFRQEPNLKQVIKIDQISAGLQEFFLDDANADIHGNKRYTVSFDCLLRIFPKCEEVHYINDYRFDNEILAKLLRILQKQREQNQMHIDQKATKKGMKALGAGPITIAPSHSAATPEPNTGYSEHIESKFQFEPAPIQHTHNLKKIVFLYYSYQDGVDNDGQQLGYPSDGDKFFHPKGLDTNLKKQLRDYGWAIVFDFIGDKGKTGCKIRIFEQRLRRKQTMTFKEFGKWQAQKRKSQKSVLKPNGE